MSDSDLRELERAAALGDERAHRTLLVERLRLATGYGNITGAAARLESHVRVKLVRALSGVESRHAGVATLDDVAALVLRGLKAPAIVSGLIWRSAWTWKGAREARVLAVAVKAGGPRFGEIAIGIGVTRDTRRDNTLAVGNIWPALRNGFPLESDERDVAAGRTRPDIKSHREGLAVLWATQVRTGHGRQAVRARVEVAEWWARERLGRWS